MGLPEIRADAKLAAEAIATATTVDELKQQLLDNLIPLFDGLAGTTEAELAGRDVVIQALCDDVEELIDETGDVLQPETTTKILAVINQGSQLAKELETLLKKADDMTKKRALGLIKAYRQGAIVVSEYLAEITVPVDEDDEDDEAEGAKPKKKATPVGDDVDEDEDEEDDDDTDEDVDDEDVDAEEDDEDDVAEEG